MRSYGRLLHYLIHNACCRLILQNIVFLSVSLLRFVVRLISVRIKMLRIKAIPYSEHYFVAKRYCHKAFLPLKGQGIARFCLCYAV